MFYTINNIKSLEDMIKFWKTPTCPLKNKKIKRGKKTGVSISKIKLVLHDISRLNCILQFLSTCQKRKLFL